MIFSKSNASLSEVINGLPQRRKTYRNDKIIIILDTSWLFGYIAK